MPGLKNLLDGVLRFRATVRKDLVKQFELVRNNPQPASVFFTCMDSRILPARFVQAQVGDMFVVRNSANLIPNAVDYENQVTTEPAALELAVKRGGIKHVIVCGHSDCKAINTLYNLHKHPEAFDPASPMDNWLRKHGYRSVAKLVKMMESDKSGDASGRKVQFSTEDPTILNFSAYIDPDNEFGVEDRLSQINALQQIVHVASHGFIQDYIRQELLHLHVLWFDIWKGDMHMFSRRKSRFVLIDENSVDELETEARGIYVNSKVAETRN